MYKHLLFADHISAVSLASQVHFYVEGKLIRAVGNRILNSTNNLRK